MQVSVTFRHMNATDALRQYAEDKIDKALRKYLRSPFDAHVVLSAERHQHNCDVTVSVSGHTIKGTERNNDMYSAIDRVGDKLERQVRRYKDKLRNHKPSALDAGLRAPEVLISLLDQQDLLPAANGVEAEPEPAPEPKVLETKTVTAQPMSVDDAVMSLDLSQAAFLVFTNKATNGIAVVYRREDGKYGLVDTKPPGQ
jgi:putative sigma-54 modulation protein